MRGEVVLDASAAAKLFITEEGSDAVRALAASDAVFIAPEFVLAELANVAVKRLRRGDIPRELAERMVEASRSVFRELVPAAALTRRAFELAADAGLSTYDALYVALAEQRRCELATADRRLVARCQSAGLVLPVFAP
ncbi:MAG: type II toxin-antitoxin system VapC family toxin [Caulobacteraceae bacterium]